jgi:hypothetical protein
LLNTESAFVGDFARELARELAKLEQSVPRGQLSAAELSEIAAYRDTAHFTGEVFEAGLGFVTASDAAHAGSWRLPPIGRNIHVLTTPDPLTALTPYRPLLTSCAFAGDPALGAALRRAFPGARLCRFGEMQRPPFDGPVDRREL